MQPDEPARPRGQHAHNLAFVARLTSRLGPVSRARLAAESGLTKSTVTQLTGELIDGGLVRELGIGPASGPGRPANQLVLNSQGPAAIGLQVEADHVAGCLTDLTGRVRDRAIRRAGEGGELRGDPAIAVRAAEAVLRRLLNTAGSTDNVVAGIVVGVPGRVVGSAVSSLELGWRETDLARVLGDRLGALGAGGIPVTLDDSANLAALAEYRFGAASPDGVLVHVGGEDGVGAGIVVGGAVHRGVRGAAGELGHVRVRATGGDECRCGARGCLDTVAGHSAMLRAARLGDRAASRLAHGEGPLPAAVRDGQRAARTALRRAAAGLGTALGGLVAVLDPEVIVLGGHFGGLGESFAGAVSSAIADRAPALGAGAAVRPTRLPADAVARAAADTCTRELIENPARWLSE